MTEETNLILNAIGDLREDIREIRNDQKAQGEKISDLCTRTALTDQQIKDQIKSETRISKTLSYLSPVAVAIVSVYMFFKNN